MNFLSHIKLLSLEQATVVPYLTYRLVQDGVQVIRLEHPVYGDPNRMIGANVLDEERMNAYFLCINAGKKSVTLNLAQPEGQEILLSMIESLDIDIFITNQLPRNYKKLGIEYDILKSTKPDLIWMGITGFGLDNNEGAYDPILQARSGLMELTGEPEGVPQTIGIPLPDMGTSEHAYGLLMKALLIRQATGKGTQINLSMFESSVSWLTTPITMSATFGYHITRRGNTHEFFCPVYVYETRNGFIYLAVGNDRQWKAMVSQDIFKALDKPEYEKNNGRVADAVNLHDAINSITTQYSSEYLIDLLNSITVPVSKIKTIAEVIDDPLVKKKLLKTTDPISKKEITLAPAPYTTPYLETQKMQLIFPPRFGEHNREIYCDQIGYSEEDLARLKHKGII